MPEEGASFRRYPGATLDECIRLVELVVSKMGMGTHTAEDLASALGMSAAGGATKRKIAAMAAFGLLDRGAGQYSISGLTRSLLRPMPGERPTLLRKAFENVPLYRDVLQAFAEQGRLPDQDALAATLVRKYGIANASGDYAAKVLLESAAVAGIIDSERRFESALRSQSPDESRQTQQTIADLAGQASIEPTTRLGTTSISLQKPFAELTVAANLSARDLARIGKWLDQAAKPWLSFQVEEDDLGGEDDA